MGEGKNFIVPLKTACLCVAVVWGVYLLDLVLPLDLCQWGIRPRAVAGLPGIILSPFLHVDFKHLLANSGALLVLLTLTLWLLGAAAFLVLALVVLVGGGFVWLFGQSHSLHLGASGVVFGLVGFLLAAGLLHRRLILGLAAGLVLFFYGGLIWGLFSFQPGVSWAGHFGGLLAGVVAAWLFRPTS